AQLLQDLLDVLLYGAHVRAQDRGDLAVGLAPRQPGRDLLLARRQLECRERARPPGAPALVEDGVSPRLLEVGAEEREHRAIALGEFPSSRMAKGIERAYTPAVGHTGGKAASDSYEAVELVVQLGPLELGLSEEIREHHRGVGAMLDHVPS